MVTTFRWRLIAVLVLLALRGMAPRVQATEAKEGAEITSLSWHCTAQGNRATVTISTRYLILNARGKELAVVVLWENPFCKLSAVEIRSIDSSNKIVSKRSLKHMSKHCGYGSSFTLYDDNCQYYLDAALPGYPYTVEVDYTMDYSSLFFVTYVPLPSEFAIRQADLTLNVPYSQTWSHRLWGAEGSPSEITIGDRRELRWQLFNLPAIEEILYAPPEANQDRRLQLTAPNFTLGDATFGDCTWRSAGLFYKALADPCYLVGGSNIEPAATEAEKRVLCSKLYQRVVDETRYIAISVGLSGWQPRRATQVKQTGYGDCKDMTTLLISYLRAGGIQAYPSLIMTNDEGATDSGFVDLKFNHVITMAVIGQDTIWMDPTCQSCPCGDLPATDENTFVLVVTDTGGVLVRSPASRTSDNQIVRTTVLTIDSAFVCTGSVSAFPTGNYAISWRRFVSGATPDELRDGVCNWFGLSQAKYNVSGQKFSGEGSTSEPVIIEAAFKSLRPIDRIQNTAYVFPFLYTSREAYEGLKLSTRSVGLDLGFATTIIDTVWLKGAGLSLDSVVFPTDTIIEGLDNRLKVSYASDSLGIRAVWSLEYKRRQIDTSEFDHFANFLAGRKKVLDRPIKIVMLSPQ